MKLQNNLFGKLWILAFLLPVIVLACTKESDCRNIACSDVFFAVSVKVTDTSNQVVVLDEVYTISTSNGERITPHQSITITGWYNVLDDSYQHKIANSSAEFQFIGMKNGRRVVDELYQVSADCCHIQKVSGKENVVISP